ncbi:MAG TPA: SRPBCC domain-containing protein [Bacteroidota bacterium]|nr:SRPBCC domain-containing protein [Bacteroidota bacterium]
METLTFSIDIAASAATVWNVLFEKDSYEQWTKPFSPGSTFKGRFALGERVHFLSSEPGGMYSDIEYCVPGELLVIRHLGVLSPEGEEVPPAQSGGAWSDARESYRLTSTAGGVRLDVSVDVEPEYLDFMRDTFEAALEIVKDLSHNQS